MWAGFVENKLLINLLKFQCLHMRSKNQRHQYTMNKIPVPVVGESTNLGIKRSDNSTYKFHFIPVLSKAYKATITIQRLCPQKTNTFSSVFCCFCVFSR